MTSPSAPLPRVGLGLILVSGALVASPLHALAQAFGPPQVRDPFTEPGRFTVRALRLGGQGPIATMPGGGRIEATIELAHDCPACAPGTVNQIIVGLAGEQRAQACLYSGPGRSGGYRAARFALVVPSQPGTYEVRARYAQAFDCRRALDWWRVDRAEGPGPESTVGYVTVPGAPRSPMPPPPATARSAQAIRQEIDGRLEWIDQQGERLERGQAPRLDELGWQLQAQLRVVDDLLDEYATALRREAGAPGAPGMPAPPPPLAGMAPGDFARLLDGLHAESSERDRMEQVRSAIAGGARFSVAQAVELIDAFDFSQGKAQVAASLCKSAMAEDGGLPRILAEVPDGVAREQLRRATGGRCDAAR